MRGATFFFVSTVTFLRPRPNTIISGMHVYTRTCWPPAGNYSARAPRVCSRYGACVYVVNRTVERHSVVVTFVIRPSASYRRLLFDRNIFFFARNSPRTARINQSYTFDCKSSPRLTRRRFQPVKIK